MTDANQQPSWVRNTPDFTLLEGSDEYTRYFNLLNKCWSLLLNLYEKRGSADTFEARKIARSLERLLYTVKALRMKYSNSPAERRMLWIDLSDSGFPNAQDIGNLSVDLIKRQERMRDLMPVSMLKQIALDHMLKQQTDPVDLIWQISERSYLEMLEDTKLFLPFNLVSDDIAIRPTKDRRGPRSYSCAWSCYDFRSNCPYVHLLTFDQDRDEKSLEKGGPNQIKLLEVLQSEGSRVPDVGILAMAIDGALETIHPKILKRIGFGPLYTVSLLEKEVRFPKDETLLDPPSEKPKLLLELLKEYAEPDEFILCFKDEIVFSKEQRITPTSHVREVFYLPNDDPETYAKRASVIHKFVLMPHSVSQHLTSDIIQQVPEFQQAQIITYDSQGSIYNAEKLEV
jgi:hypothetical protein